MILILIRVCNILLLTNEENRAKSIHQQSYHQSFYSYMQKEVSHLMSHCGMLLTSYFGTKSWFSRLFFTSMTYLTPSLFPHDPINPCQAQSISLASINLTSG